MIEKKIRKFFNNISISSCPCKACAEDICEPEELDEEIEVTPEEEEGITLKEAARFAAKTFLILASVLVVGKTVALLVDLVSGEDESNED
ncbi:MAG: hypothetical protein IJW87_04005 [Clostridia bacterium]|nr:hypothetical protein [Clostridia bacterium]